MCKHCEKLVEDKEVVHRFFEVGAARLNEMLPKRMGRPLHRPVTADDVAPVSLTVTAYFWQDSPFRNTEAQERTMRMLYELDADTAIGVAREEDRMRNMSREDQEHLRNEIGKLMAKQEHPKVT